MTWQWKHIANIIGAPGDVPASTTLYYRGALALGTDANDVKTPGVHGVATTPVALSMLNLPEQVPGNLTVFGAGSGITTQKFTPNLGGEYVRSVSTASSTFGPWIQIDSRGRLIPDGTDIALFRDLGNWRIASTVAAGTMLNRPPVTPAPALIENLTHSGTTATVMRWTCMDGSGVWLNRFYLGMWNGWERLDGGGGGGGGDKDVTQGHYGTPNSVRLDDFRTAFPLVTTGNKGAVIFRWDHGLTNFKTSILPLHNTHGIPCIIGMNSRNWAKEENSGMTKAEAQALAQAGFIQWGNHGADGNPTGTHKDESSMAGLWDQIVIGRRELEADLGIPIHQYIVPGTTGSNQGGLGTAASIDVLSSTYAGSLVLAHHATTTGYFPNTIHRKLDGIVKQGQSHWNIEQRTVAEVKAQIDLAVTNKTALCLMGHPRELNRGAGYYTTAMLSEIFAYIKTKIDAGQLANLSPLQSLHAKL